MTDTGQVPGEGLPENAGTVEQQGAPAPDAYTYLSDSPTEDEDLLLPGAQGAWGNEVAPPAPEPVVETVHEPGPHEAAGRDSGSVDLSGVRHPEPHRSPSGPAASASPSASAVPSTPRRPLHLGPPIPDPTAGPVRSLADRGPADPSARHAGPPTLGPEYLDIPLTREAAAPRAASSSVAQATAGAGVPAGETGAAPAEPAATAVTHQDTEGGAGVAVTGSAAQQAQARHAPQPAGAPDAWPADTTSATVPGQRPAEEASGPVRTAEPAEVPSGEAPAEGAVPDHAPESEVPQPAGAPSAEATASAYAPGPQAPAAQAPGSVPGEPEHGHAAGTPGADQQAPAGDDGTAPTAAPPSTEVPDGAVPPQGGMQEAAAEQPGAVPAPDAQVAVPYPQALQAPTPLGTTVEEPRTGQAPGTEFTVPGPAQAQHPAQGHEAPQATQVPATESAAPEYAPADSVPQSPASPDTTVSPHSVPTPAAGTTVPPAAAAGPDAPSPDTTGPEAEVAAPATPEPAVPGTAGGPAEEPASQAVVTGGSEADAAVGADVVAAPGGTVSPAGPEPVQTSQQTADTAVPGAVSQAVVTGGSEADAAVGADVVAAPGGTLSPAGPEPVQTPQQTADTALPGTVPPAPVPDQSIGRFVPVEGTVPTGTHLAPTPPQGTTVPAVEADAVPATPAPEPAQNLDDLDTRSAGAAPAPPAGPPAPGYDEAEREAVRKVMRERRDIRNGFRSDPIPDDVLLRVLEAAHTAPSVGHSQPWDFVVIRSAETRRAMHELAVRQREAYAKSLPKGRAKQFKELKIEAILDTPVNIVVTADPTRGGRHTLGRHTQPQMAPYSSALAVENLWLAARAEGLGVGWVSFFDEREMVRALGLPEHLEVVAYLCVGHVDEFPPEPELMQAGWSKRRPLSWVVHEETYGRRALPGEDPHDLLAETVAQIRPLDAKALGEAWERQKRMTKPAGALGMLEIISAQLCGLSRQCPPPIPEPAAVVVFAGDHGVHAQGVTPWSQEVTAQMVANFLGGGAVCNAFAAQVGAEVCVVDVGVASDLPATPGLLPRKIRAGTSDMTTGPAMTREEAKRAIEVGIETARDLVAAGNKALLTGEMGIANTTVSAALVSVFTGADPAEVTGRGTGINDETLARKTDVVRRALELHRPDPADPLGVLAAIGGFEHAALVGLLLGGASLRTPVILDGVSAGAAALVARAIAPEVLAACIAGHRSAEPGHAAALNKLGLRPLVDLDLRLGEGTGALLALPLVQSTARAMHEVATFDSAGVAEQ